MIRLMRRLFWVTAAGGLAVGGWSFWKLRSNNDELPQGNWSPIPNQNAGSGASSKSTSATQAGSTSQGFASSAAGTASAPTANARSAASGSATVGAAKSGAKKSSTATAAPAGDRSTTSGKAPGKKSAADKQSKPATAKATKSTAKPAVKTPANAKVGQKWVEPDDNGSCPADFAVKANDGSKIYHVPTGRSYKRTKAERCYATPEDAAADGYRPAKA